MVWHTQTYRFPSLPEVRRVYPLYPSAAAAVEAMREHRTSEWEKAKGLPAWFTFLHGQHLAEDLPPYARTVVVYRGQSDVSWPLIPTLYRGLRADESLQSTLRERVEQRDRVTASIFNSPTIETQLPGAGRFSDLQKEAVARHYGAPSSLVDVTCEPEVAAVFATRMNPRGEVGFVYAINVVELLSLAGASTCSRTAGGYQLALWPVGMTEIRYLEPNPPEPPIEQSATIRFSAGVWKSIRLTFSMFGVPDVARINAQRGVFISMRETPDGLQARQMWNLVDVVSQKYFFRHTGGGYVPDNPDFYEDNLMPPNDPIARLAAR